MSNFNKSNCRNCGTYLPGQRYVPLAEFVRRMCPACQSMYDVTHMHPEGRVILHRALKEATLVESSGNWNDCNMWCDPLDRQ